MRILHACSRLTVVQGDWRELELPPRSVDVTITDPPYDPHTQANVKTNANPGQLDLGFEPLEDLGHVPILLDITKRWVLCFCATSQLGAYQDAAGGMRTTKSNGTYVRDGIYRRSNPAPQMSGDRPGQSCEGLAIMHARRQGMGRMSWNRGGHAGWWECAAAFAVWLPNYEMPFVGDKEAVLAVLPAAHRQSFTRNPPATGQVFSLPGGMVFGLDGDAVPDYWCTSQDRPKFHPAHKPEALCRDLVGAFSNPGETVFDPYAGGGSIGIAALDMGREVVAAELDGEVAEKASERLTQHCGCGKVRS